MGGEFITVQSGPFEGCTKFDWSSDWEASIAIYLGFLFAGVGLAVFAGSKGYLPLGLFGFMVLFCMGIAFIAPYCGEGAEMWGVVTSNISIWVMVALSFVSGILVITERDRGLKPGGWLGKLVYSRMGTPRKGFMEIDWFMVGPLNDFLSATVAETLVLSIVVAWLVLSGVTVYYDLMDEDMGMEEAIGNKPRAVGRALAQVSMRLIFLSLASAQRNTVVYNLFSMPYDRSVKWHKVMGRLQLGCMYGHVVCMVIGGTNPKFDDGSDREMGFSDTFSLIRGRNLWPGLVALLFWTMLGVTSIPYVRRKFFDVFYFLHIQFFFMGNVFTVFHNRAGVVWVAAGIALFWVDAGIRLIVKLTNVEVKSLEIVAGKASLGAQVELTEAGAKVSPIGALDDGDKPIVKMVIKQDGYPKAFYQHTVGSWIFLSVGGTIASPGEELTQLMPAVKVPGGAPSGLPSALWFHPMTITRYDETTSEITLFVKSYGPDQFSGQLCSLASKVASGEVALSDIKAHVGGPHGNPSVDHLEMDGGIVLLSGGIGITAMAVILEDICVKKKAGQLAASKVSFLWSTRSSEECGAFSYLWDLCAGCGIDLRVYGTKGVKGFLVPNGTCTEGRFDMAAVFAGQPMSTGKWGIFACGPEAMMIDAEALYGAKKGAGADVYFHRETFEW